MTTKKFTLRTAHTEWLLLTGQFYNEILYFYYQLFLGHEELHRMGNQKAMRSLERLSIVGKAGEAVECPLPWKGVPLYFRRAAINTAMAAGKSIRVKLFLRALPYIKGCTGNWITTLWR